MAPTNRIHYQANRLNSRLQQSISKKGTAQFIWSRGTDSVWVGRRDGALDFLVNTGGDLMLTTVFLDEKSTRSCRRHSGQCTLGILNRRSPSM